MRDRLRWWHGPPLLFEVARIGRLPSRRSVPVIFPTGETAMAELQPQSLPFMDDKGSRQVSPLCVIDLRAPAAGHAGQRTFEGAGCDLRRHAERQRHGIRAYAEIWWAAGNPRDAAPHHCLPRLLHLPAPIAP